MNILFYVFYFIVKVIDIFCFVFRVVFKLFRMIIDIFILVIGLIEGTITEQLCKIYGHNFIVPLSGGEEICKCCHNFKNRQNPNRPRCNKCGYSPLSDEPCYCGNVRKDRKWVIGSKKQ